MIKFKTLLIALKFVILIRKDISFLQCKVFIVLNF